MSLSLEWQRRIEGWEKALWEVIYRPLECLVLEGFTTHAQLSPWQVQAGPFRLTPPGERWGAKWEYAWFKSRLVLPPAAEGKRIVLRLNLGGECLVWLDGAVAGSVDWAHSEITLSRAGIPGQAYDLLVEAYAGHEPVSVGEGPLVYGKTLMPEPPPEQAVVGESSLGIWEEDLYQAALDFSALVSLYKRLDPNSLRASEVGQGLIEATLLFDPELPPAELNLTALELRRRLAPLLACTNGSTSPTLFAFGHAHLDVAWLWPLAETERKMARTTANQLALMAEYPDYRYLQSQPHLYWMLKRTYPELYARVLEAARSGQWMAEGGMWVEADANLSGGESLIRQLIYGKRFFREEFGVDSRVLWLPDVFGYSGALPQILLGCGIQGFATQKINWIYNGGDPFPHNTFLWEGIDGSQVTAHIFNDYNAFPLPENMIDRWNERNQKDGIDSMLLSFGWGDGGGGPARDHLEYARRLRDLEGAPRLRMASPGEFFDHLRERRPPDRRYVGELYFQAHRGVYTSQARTKAANRRAEFALREAELWGSLARWTNGFDFGPGHLENEWRTLLLNQFHDILPGSSIQRVYQEAEAGLGQVIEQAESIALQAASNLAGKEDGEPSLAVFNSLSWPRTVMAPLPDGFIAPGRPVQSIEGRLWTEVEAPACGWTSIALEPFSDPETAFLTQPIPQSGDYVLENEYLRVAFDEWGQIASLLDKESGFELADGPCNRFLLYKDIPSRWDAWDIESSVFLSPVALPEKAEMERLACGPLVTRLRIRRMIGGSPLEQVVSLRCSSRRLDFRTEIDWQETHRLLKVAFPVRIRANEAVHEIQFGHLRRPNHASRPFDADRFEVCNHKWSALVEENRGFAVLNDSKYGINAAGNSLNLSLLKAPVAPDPNADRGSQTFTYACLAWNGNLANSDLVRQAYDLNRPPLLIPGGRGQASLFSLDKDNVVIETVKPAEDGSQALVLRLYEATRSTVRCRLHSTLPVGRACLADMLENPLEELDWEDGGLTLEFRPFEIKTLILHPSV
jgi:alpha-mannosidase